jgi:peptide/nickel transport system substrate-binding protein
MLRAVSRSLPIALLLLGACRDTGKARVAGGEQTGGTMVIVQPFEPATLFPPKVTGTEGFVIIGALFDRLAEIGDDLNTSSDSGFTPRLATGWTWASDSLSIAFSLHPGIRWHDGAPLRAQDVRFSFATYTSDDVASVKKSLLGNIDSVSVRDSLTAVFWFKRRLPHQFFDATYHMYILPSHLLDTIAPEAMAASPFGRNPVGTGRFRFVSWEKGQRLEILADTANARKRANLDRVIWTFASDHGAATIKLFAGDADFYEAILPSSLPQVEKSAVLRLESYPALKYEFLGYNLRGRGDSASAHPLFGDVRVRRALAMAVDRASLTRNVYDTLGSVALSAAPRFLIPDTTGLRQIPFDPAAARAILDSLGWIPNAKDGIRERNGVRFSFEVMAQQSSQSRQQFAQLLEQQFRAVGVEARPRTVEGRVMGEQIMKQDFDAFVYAWQMTPGRLGMAQTWRSDGEQNFGKYNSPEFDVLLDSAMTSLRSASRTQRWTSVFQRLIDDQPALWLAESRTPVAIHRRIRNTTLRADGWESGLADWSIDPSQRIDRDRIGLRSAR